jgi:DNA-binding XRE family transcriptional regulator
MELRNRLMKYRIKNGLSQKSMADAVGINIKTLAAIERRQKKPNEVTQFKIETFLNEREG